MKVGINTAAELKEKSVSLSVPFADLLRGYLTEDILQRIYRSDYREVFWLADDHAIGLEQYRSRKEERLEFYYLESEKTIPPEKRIPGQKLSEGMADHLLKELLFKEQPQGVRWEGSLKQKADYYDWKLNGEFCEMQAPLTVRLRRLSGNRIYHFDYIG